jgi:hypothetical protein
MGSMTRKNRSIQPCFIYHLIARFVGGEWFIKSDVERLAYLTLLRLYLQATDWRCFAYAIMSNHIHLALLAGGDSLRSWLRPVHNEFADWINARSERNGAVFVRGPKMIGVQNEPEAVRRLVSYIHCNPVRAGVVSTADESSWTSHRAYLGAITSPSWLDVQLGLDLCRFTAGEELDTFARTTPVDRQALEAVLLNPPRRPGRPPKVANDECGSDFLPFEPTVLASG